MRSALLALTLALGAYGCQTVGPPLPPESLPAPVTRLFGACAPGDGAVTAHAFNADGLLGSAELSWVAKTPSSWLAEVTNPMGLTVLSAKRQHNQLRLSGSLAKRLPAVTIGEDGWLEVSGQRLALKAEEVPCLLRFTFPQPWLSRATDRTLDGTTLVVEFDDDGRHMTLRLPPASVAAPPCVQITWRHHLFFTEAIDWCHGTAAGSLAGAGDYSLKWVKLDDH